MNKNTPRALSALLVLALAFCAPAEPAATVQTAQIPAPDTVAQQDWGQITEADAAAPIAREEYAERRAALAEQMQDGIFVAFGSAEPAADYLPYEQNAHFRYLTGIVEPGAAVVMVRDGGEVSERLFVLPADPAREVWEGARLGTDGAEARTGIPAETEDRMMPVLDSLVAAHPALYTVAYQPGEPEGAETRTHEQQLIDRLLERNPDTQVRSLGRELEQLRGTKSPAELSMIRRAIQVSNLAHLEAMRHIEPGMNEFEIRALVEYTFLRSGAEGPGYASIVGSGPNATVLHYRDADRFMEDGELLLMDVGASYRGYTADITRTFPVNGSFSEPQREIYEIVLAAQIAAEDEVRAGATWQQLNGAANERIANGLVELGLIDDAAASYDCLAPDGGTVQCSQYQLFYMHGLGHGIGLDVHDPDRSYFTTFGPGSAFTIEPGIYVRRDVFDYLPDTEGNRAMADRLRPAFERYVDIGVRLEDNYVITEDGVERVSDGIPREIEEIEALMREPSFADGTRDPEVVEWYRESEPR